MSVIASIGAVVAAWWLSTGLILLAIRRLDPEGTALRLLTAALFALPVSIVFFGPLFSSMSGNMAGVWAGFLAALSLWAGHEIAFLAGWLAGPRRIPAPKDRLPSLAEAFATIRDRHIAIAGTAAALLAASSVGSGSVALSIFLLLWGLRILAEINLFLGAPNVATSLIPARLAHIATYFRTDRISPALLPTIALLLSILVMLLRLGLTHPEPPQALFATLLASLVALAIVEMAFFVLPFGEDRLWRWTGSGGRP